MQFVSGSGKPLEISFRTIARRKEVMVRSGKYTLQGLNECVGELTGELTALCISRSRVWMCVMIVSVAEITSG